LAASPVRHWRWRRVIEILRSVLNAPVVGTLRKHQ
jgi:hypothetical protein